MYSAETLNSFVKDEVEEEDRNCNLMIFGLPESDNEQLNNKTSEVFEQLDETLDLEKTHLVSPICRDMLQ